MFRSIVRGLSALVLLLQVCPAPGQGAGSPAGTARVPRLEIDHQAVVEANALHLLGASPGVPVILLVSHGANPVPLASLGYGPAVIGPDLASPFGAAVLQGLFTNALGELDLPFVAPPAVAHLETHMQALTLDPSAPFGGLAVSEHLALMFGFERSGLPIAAGPAGSRTLADAFAYGALAQPLDPRLADLTILPIELANDNEMSFGRGDRPVPIDVPGVGRGLHLADASVLFVVRSSTLEEGLIRVRPDGRIEVLVWFQGNGGVPWIQMPIAASPFEALVAITTKHAVAEYGNRDLLLVRTDGWNVDGAAVEAVGVAMPAGVTYEPMTLAFLNGALFLGNAATRIDRVNLATRAVTPVALPTSGGVAPSYMDEVCSIAADGSAFAFGAGGSENVHDVYVVDAAGMAINLTQNPADYEDAGPGLADGMQLAMAPDGSSAAYMRTVVETETFVRSTAPGAPELHVTNPGEYIDSIDTVVGLGFAASGQLLLAAGNDVLATDLYRATLPTTGPVNQIANLSATSGQTAPIFGLGASLQLDRVFTAPQTRIYTLDNTAGPRRLQIVDAGGGTAGADLGTLLATAPGPGCTVIVDQLGDGSIRLRLFADQVGGALLATWQSAASAQLICSAAGRADGESAWILQVGTASQLVIVQAGANLFSAAGPQGIVQPTLTFDGRGNPVANVIDPFTGLLGVQRFDRIAAAWIPAASNLPSGLNGRFLR